MSKLLSEREVEERYGMKIRTLRKWRWSGEGPPYAKLGRSVRYRPEDIEDFIKCRLRTSTSSPRIENH